MGNPAGRDAPTPLAIAQQRVEIDAPAKINWVLNVLGRRADGYHEIDTLMQTISLADRLTIEAISGEPGLGAGSGPDAEEPDAQPRLTCSDPSLPTGPENLVWRAWEAMRRAFPGRVGAVSIHIEKRIPHGAGLGGGSSDAAAAMRALNEIFGLGAPPGRLAEIAAEIGSDVPFFIRGGLARARGRGEIIEPIPAPGATIPAREAIPASAGPPRAASARASASPPAAMFPKFDLVVLFPGFPTPTAAAYRALNAAPLREGETGESWRIDAATRAIARSEPGATGDPAAMAAVMANAFDAALAGPGTPYTEIKTRMAAEGLVGAMLSGSGSAVFALAKDSEHARAAAASLSTAGAPAFAAGANFARRKT